MDRLAFARQILREQSFQSDVSRQRDRPLLSWGVRDEECFIPHGSAANPALHEFFGQVGHGGASLYAMQLAMQIMSRSGNRNVFYICASGQREAGCLNASVLPVRLQASLIFIHPQHPRDVLWAFEECLRSEQATCVIAEVPFLDLKTSRRLQLACERGGSYAFALCHDTRGMEKSTVARTRWQIMGQGNGLWTLKLFGGRGVRPNQWRVKHDGATFPVSLVPATECGALYPQRHIA